MGLKKSVCNFFDTLTEHIKKIGADEEDFFTKKEMEDAMNEILKDIQEREKFEIGEEGELNVSEYKDLKSEAQNIYKKLIQLQENAQSISEIEKLLSVDEKIEHYEKTIEGLQRARVEREEELAESVFGKGKEFQTLEDLRGQNAEMADDVTEFLLQTKHSSVAIHNKARDIVFRLRGSMKAGGPSLSIVKFHTALKKFGGVLNKIGLAQPDFWGQLWAEARGMEKFLEREVLEKGKPLGKSPAEMGIAPKQKLKESISSVQEIYGKLDWVKDVGEKLKRIWNWLVSNGQKLFNSLKKIALVLDAKISQLKGDLSLLEELDISLFTDVSIDGEVTESFASFASEDPSTLGNKKNSDDLVSDRFLEQMG